MQAFSGSSFHPTFVPEYHFLLPPPEMVDLLFHRSFLQTGSALTTSTSLQPSTFLSRATGMANNLVSDSRPPPSNVEYKRQTWWSTNEMPCMPCPQGRDGSAPTVGLWVPSTSFIEKHLRSKTPLWAS